MNRSLRVLRVLRVAALLGVLVCPVALAQYPSKPVRIVVPNAAGGITEIMARAFGDRLKESLGQPFLIEAMPGGGTLLATQHVARQPADGHTLLIQSTTITTLPSLRADAGYDPVRDFNPVAGMGSNPLLVTVHRNLGVKDVRGLIEYLKANPGKLSAAVAGSGTFDHLGAVKFMQASGTQLTIVPYKGQAPSYPDLLAGRVEVNFYGYSAFAEQFKAGLLVPLAVAGRKRLAQIPATPTLDESAMPGFEAEVWFAFFAPAGLPRPIAERLNREFNRVQQLAEMREIYEKRGLEPLLATPEQLADLVKRNYESWSAVIRKSGIKLDQ